MNLKRTARILLRSLGRTLDIIFSSIFYTIRALVFLSASLLLANSHDVTVIQASAISIIIELTMQLLTARQRHNNHIEYLRMATITAVMQLGYDMDPHYISPAGRKILEEQLVALHRIDDSHPGNPNG